MENEKVSKSGVFIDIDGVVLQGGKPFEWSKKAIHALWDNKVPFVFVTNGTYCSKTLINNLTSILELPFTNDHVMCAPSPCTDLVEFHDKRVLACCQDDSFDLIGELGFSNFLTISELVEVFPELDYVDHEKRKQLLKSPMSEEQLRRRAEFKPVEAILLLGEPINWECSLQIIIDILMTNGDPRTKFKFVPYPHLPIITCNKDLTFKGAADLPRFGHGAFLECLEALYMRITRNDLVYVSQMGKPYLVTYEYAAKKIQKQANFNEIIDKFYIIGDNPEVDIRGANIFKAHLLFPTKRHSQCDLLNENFKSTKLRKPVEAILVCTGVYNPQSDLLFYLNNLFDQTMNQNCDEQTNDDDCLTLQVPSLASRRMSKKDSATISLVDMEKLELKKALSRKNSFISYFENKLNVPDLTVDNLLDAVNYIVSNCQ